MWADKQLVFASRCEWTKLLLAFEDTHINTHGERQTDRDRQTDRHKHTDRKTETDTQNVTLEQTSLQTKHLTLKMTRVNTFKRRLRDRKLRSWDVHDHSFKMMIRKIEDHHQARPNFVYSFINEKATRWLEEKGREYRKKLKRGGAYVRCVMLLKHKWKIL